ncbi:MAG TPA: serine/threonine protein kinase [Polyangiaceae bacterium]|nr:serine/threonine protein kinase [Polyangiaceae bacterium]
MDSTNGDQTQLPAESSGESVDARREPQARCCEICGGHWPVELPICPSCTLAEMDALDTDKPLVPEPRIDPSFAGFQLLEQLGEGGQAVVHRAWHARSERQVALKVLKWEHADDADLTAQFKRSADLIANLDHPNIVRIDDRSGLAEYPPFYTMQLITGGTLRERERFRQPGQAAEVVIKIARAVHHAHENGVLHRDLTPSNVLLDMNNEPHVTDFMALRTLHKGGHPIVGAYNYMAPEQALGRHNSVCTDVYQLGGLLYELLTGQPPISASDLQEVKAQHESHQRSPLRPRVPGLNPDMAAVCAAALSVDPGSRHSSAALFAESLQRVLDLRPPIWPKVSRTRRALLWTKRRPLLALGAFLGLLLLALADTSALRDESERQREDTDATLRAHIALATAQANQVLSLFERYAVEAASATNDPEIRAYIDRGEVGYGVPTLTRVFAGARLFDSFAVFGLEGRILARYPDARTGFPGTDFSFRDYYNCVTTLMKQPPATGRDAPPLACISPAYRGEASGNIEFTVTSPVHDTAGDWIGFVIMNRHAHRNLDLLDMGTIDERVTAVYAPRGVDRGEPPLSATPPKPLTAVAHPLLFSKVESRLDADLSERLRQQFGSSGSPGDQFHPIEVRPVTDTDFIDPVTSQRSIAAFAPVGATGYVVAVSTPKERLERGSRSRSDALIFSVGLLNLGLLLLGAVALGARLDESKHSKGR